MSADDSYDQVRHNFEDLEIEERARFLIEASASTLAKGVEQVGHVLAEGLEDVIRHERRSETRAEESGPGAAEPETAQRQASSHDSSSEDED
jgi:NCAIR mutase (PurE)-related protein